MNRWYYTLDNKERLGPVTSEQLRQLALSGTIHPEHMLMREGSGKWVSAAKAKGLFPTAKVPTAQIPPSAEPLSPGTTTVACPGCGRGIALPFDELTTTIECARCNTRFIPVQSSAPAPMLPSANPANSHPVDAPAPRPQEAVSALARSQTPPLQLVQAVDTAVAVGTALAKAQQFVARPWWRPISPSFLVLALVVFPLPWIEVSCSGGQIRGKVLASQSGFQSIYGGVTTGTLIPPKERSEWEAEKNRDQERFGFWDRFAPPMLAYAPMLAMAAFFGFLLRASRLRAALIVALTGLVFFLLLMQTAIGFPLERVMNRSMERAADKEGFGAMAALVFDVRYTGWFWIGLLSIMAAMLACALEWFAIRSIYGSGLPVWIKTWPALSFLERWGSPASPAAIPVELADAGVLSAEESAAQPVGRQLRRIPRWLLVVIPAGLLLCLTLAVVGVVTTKIVGPKAMESTQTVSHSGDVSVECLEARSDTFVGKEWGQWRSYGPLLVIKLKLTNTSPTKIVKFGGWQGKATLADEHGNQYKAVNFGNGFEGFGDGPWGNTARLSEEDQHLIAYNLSLHPGKSYTTYLFYEKPAAVSREARLTLPAKEIGESGTIRVRVPIHE